MAQGRRLTCEFHAAPVGALCMLSTQMLLLRQTQYYRLLGSNLAQAILLTHKALVDICVLTVVLMLYSVIRALLAFAHWTSVLVSLFTSCIMLQQLLWVFQPVLLQ